MRMKLGGLAVGIFLFVGAAPGWCDEIALDLAGGSSTILVEEGEAHTVTLVHYLPGQSYSFDVTVLGRLNEAFDAGGLGAPRGGHEGAAEERSRCVTAVQGLYGLADEKKIDGAIASARIANPASFCQEQIDLFKTRTQRTILDPVTVAAGEAVIVKVSRGKGSARRAWTFTLTTGQTQRWLTHYGFAFLPDRDKTFFAQENAAGDGFVVTRENEVDDTFEYEPTLTFTYVANTIEKRSAWKPRFTAGLGLDVIDDPVVLAGLSWVVGDNVNLFLGGAFHEQTRLDGTYDEGQALEMAIAEDKLNETRFTANVIAGIGFRFNGNPFKGKSQETTMTVEKPAEGEGATSSGQQGSATDDQTVGNTPQPAPSPPPPSGDTTEEEGSEGDPEPTPQPPPDRGREGA